jgi:hypothetical protein
MDNQTQTNMETNQTPQAPVVIATTGKPVTKQAQPKKKALKYALMVAVALALGVVVYFGYKNPQLFRASVIEGAPLTVPAATHLYIPNYNASPTDSGNISIKTSAGTTAESIVSMQFKIKYSPVNALAFNTNSIVFDQDTLFKSADLKSINTSTPGEISVSFFSGTPVAVTTLGQTLVKLAVNINGTPGNPISLTVSDVEVIKATAVVPATVPPTYNYSASDQFTSIASGTINLVSQANLRVLNTEALDANHVLVRFSDLLKSVGPATEYTISGLTVSSAATGYGNSTFSGYDQSTVILTTSSQTGGLPYTLQLGANNLILGNTKGNPDPNYNKAYFQGYINPDGITNSPVRISSIDVQSGTQVVLHFSGPVMESTITPINIVITDIAPAPGPNSLTVSSAVLDASLNSVTITTAQQKPDANYFVRLSGVKDTTPASTLTAGNLPLVNNRETNFFGYTVPPMTIANIKPSTITNTSDQVVVAIGQNLDTISTIRVGAASAVISDQTAGALNFTVPKDFTPGIYDVTFINKTGDTKVLEKSLVVAAPTVQMQIVSDQSKSIPAKVAPDGTTKVTFWVLVSDPVGLANIDSVTIDLGQIGGSRAQEMTKDTGLQQSGQQFYTYTTTVSKDTATKADAYKLPVEVRKGSDVADGTVDIIVTKNVLGGVPPTIDQAYVSPLTAPPDGTTKIKISAKVSDLDGADTIKSVVADLGTLGAGFVTLTNLNVAGTASQQTTGFFESAEFTLPVTTKEGTYKVTITASDDTGQIATSDLTLTVSSALTGPKIDPDKSYLSPRKSVPRDGKTTFSINAMVSDLNGISEIDSVTAYSSTLGLKPVPLLKDPSTSDAAKTALFSSQDITIPTTASVGTDEIQIVATDKNGGSAQLILQIDVTNKDTVGNAPIIFSKKAYTVPKVALNDGITSVTLYTFVRDDDDNLDSVVANLGSIGQIGPETLPDLTTSTPSAAPAPSAVDGCNTNSATIVCMQPGFKEGSDGQWFVLPNVTISTATAASTTPYNIEVIATDTTGNVTRGTIPVYVQDSLGYAADKNPPQIVTAVATAPGKIEVLFDKGISALTVSSAGSEFTITNKNDISKQLNVLGASINADGTIVSLVTDGQTPGQDYVLNASNKITDAAGNALATGAKSRAYFTGFTASDKLPFIQYVSATDTETLEVSFQDNLRPSSVKLGTGNNFDVQVFESDNPSNSLQVKSVQFEDSGNTLVVTTDQQKSGTKYRLQINNVASAGGAQLKSPASKTFKSINIRAIKQEQAANQADLNGDGKVDFIDFTMFSAVYGQVFTGAGNSAGSGAATAPVSSPSNGLPIAPAPDSTVPHTSVPASGNVTTTTTSPITQ